MSHTAGAAGRSDAGRTPAQLYCLVAGATLLAAGVLGFIADASFDTGDDLQGSELVIFEVNGIHNLVHIVSGLVLLAAFGRRGPARTVAIAFGLVYGVVTIIGLIDGEDVLGLFPVNWADHVLHAALSALGIVTGLMSRGDGGPAPAGRRSRD